MQNISDSYRDKLNVYEDFKTKAEILIRELLIQNSISYHKIESRIKDPLKLEEKIIRKNDKYNNLGDITDLVGIRIITYFEDEVDKIAKIIDSEFVLDKANSVDKRRLDNDRFGYKSLHYVASLSDGRKDLTEYSRFKDFKIEIQIRSVLQHAWAEIEHDIGYKGIHSIPDVVKRNFYRVAALLETADIEFVNIKESLKNYEATVEEEIKNHPEDVELNFASLISFVRSNSTLHSLDSELVKILNFIPTFKIDTSTRLLERLLDLGIATIKDLEIALKTRKPTILDFANIWKVSKLRGAITYEGVSLFYLCNILLAEKQNLDIIKNFYKTYYDDTDSNAEAKELLKVYREIKNIK